MLRGVSPDGGRNLIATTDGPSIHNSTVESIAQVTGEWFATHCRSRQEKPLALDLEAKGVFYFLPMIRQRRIHGGQKRIVDVPIFASYIFVCGDAQTKYDVMATGRACQVISDKNQLRLRSELIDLERALASAYQIDLYSFAAIGRRVRVRSGPLMGTVGTVTRRDGVTRIAIIVSMLGGAGAELTIDADLLEPTE